MRSVTSIQIRLVLSHMVVAFVSVFLMSTFAGSAILNAARNEFQLTLENLAISANNSLVDPMRSYYFGQQDDERLEEVLRKLSDIYPNLRYSLFYRDGSPMYDSDDLLTGNPDFPSEEIAQALTTRSGQGSSVRDDELGVENLFVAKRIELNDEVFGVLRISYPLQEALAPTRPLIIVLLAVSALVTLSVTAFAWFLAANISRPIQQLTEASSQIASGDLDARVSPSGPRDLRRLAEVFNNMASRLQTHVNELRSFAANASHELRTPLTIIKLRIEALLSGALNDSMVATRFLEEVEGEIDRLSRLVSDMLDLSRMDAGLTTDTHTRINLGTLVDEVIETFNIRAENAGVSIVKHIAVPLPSIEGNEDQLIRVLNNLFDNALRYSPKGGKMTVNLIPGRYGATVRLEVIDDGPGIPADHIPHIFERFYRAEATRPRSVSVKSSSGSGLGLALAKSIVDMHGGEIGVISEYGRGSTFWVELPAD